MVAITKPLTKDEAKTVRSALAGKRSCPAAISPARTVGFFKTFGDTAARIKASEPSYSHYLRTGATKLTGPEKAYIKKVVAAGGPRLSVCKSYPMTWTKLPPLTMGPNMAPIIKGRALAKSAMRTDKFHAAMNDVDRGAKAKKFDPARPCSNPSCGMCVPIVTGALGEKMPILAYCCASCEERHQEAYLHGWMGSRVFGLSHSRTCGCVRHSMFASSPAVSSWAGFDGDVAPHAGVSSDAPMAVI